MAAYAKTSKPIKTSSTKKCDDRRFRISICRYSAISLTGPWPLITSLLRLRRVSIRWTRRGAKVAESVRFQYQLGGNWRGVLATIETYSGSGPFEQHCHCDRWPLKWRKAQVPGVTALLSAMTVSSYCLIILP